MMTSSSLGLEEWGGEQESILVFFLVGGGGGGGRRGNEFPASRECGSHNPREDLEDIAVGHAVVHQGHQVEGVVDLVNQLT